MGQRPILKRKALALINRQKVMVRIGEGKTVLATASELGLTVQTVRRHMRYALRSESIFPNSLDAKQAGELRQMIAERLDGYNRKLATATKRAEEWLGDKNGETSINAICAIARCTQAAAKVSAELSKLFGLYAPVKVVEESLRVNLSRTEKKVTFSFDASALQPPAEPIPGLSVWAGGQLLAGVESQ